MEQKSKFDKVMGAWDILVIAFGAMIGWGWVINSGDWITTAGFAGSIIAMLIGGVMVFFVGLTYAELTSAMPQCGGEHVFSYRAMGPTGSFVCTWMIILGYVATSAFEATALPTVITYLFPEFNQVYLYSIAGKRHLPDNNSVGCRRCSVNHIYQYKRCEDSRYITDCPHSNYRYRRNSSCSRFSS